jgi:pimeloyl-ACP methyl ester carboxylesterase
MHVPIKKQIVRRAPAGMMWEGVETIRVAANHISFEVATLGTGNRLALCLHGFPEHAFSWRFQMPLLAKLGYRVWAPNLRGYGATDSPREVSAYQVETLVDDVAGLIISSGAEETLLIAHDWGAWLAWMLAMRYPHLINRLVVISLTHPACFVREFRRPVQFLKSWYMLFFQIPVLPELLLGIRQGRALAKFIRYTSSDPSRFPDEVIEVYRRNAARPGGLTAMLNWYRGLFRGGGMSRLRSQHLPKVTTPTLFIWGDADSFLGAGTTRGIEDYVPDLTFRILPGVSHWVQQEAPEAVNSMLEAWLAGTPVPEYSETNT